MGKALMIARNQAGADAFLSGDEIGLFGFNTRTAVEAVVAYTATEACTFSLLKAQINSGGSGTNNFQFRVNGGDGNMLASIAGTGLIEDASNTDVLSANDLFNIAYTDTGTDSICAYVAANVEFASGHGCFHAASTTGVSFDVENSTRFIALNGSINSDGSATEATVQFKNRGYTSIEAFQVRVSSNARTTDSIFRDRINNNNGGFSITFGPGIDGTVVDTSTASSLVSGDLVCASITLVAGVQDLGVSFVGATFKSTTGKSEVWAGSQSGFSRTASTTAQYHVIGGGMNGAAMTEAQASIRVGFGAIVSNPRLLVSSNTQTGDATLKLYKNASAVMTVTVTAGNTGWFEDTSNTVNINDTDVLSWELDEGTANSMTINSIGLTFAQPSGDVSMAGESTATLVGESIAASTITSTAEATGQFVSENAPITGAIEITAESTATLVGESIAASPMSSAGEATAIITAEGGTTESGAIVMTGEAGAVMTGESTVQTDMFVEATSTAIFKSHFDVRRPSWTGGTSKESLLNPWKKKRKKKLEIIMESDDDVMKLLEFAVEQYKKQRPH